MVFARRVSWKTIWIQPMVHDKLREHIVRKRMLSHGLVMFRNANTNNDFIVNSITRETRRA